jgi:poly(3-hydroxybutyrate) depolymerase
MVQGRLHTFNQAKYAPAGHTVYNIAMANDGYIYVPAKCKSAATANCKIHVMYHGCGQSAGYIGSELASKSGFNSHAETNGIVVLYPQATNNPQYQNAVSSARVLCSFAGACNIKNNRQVSCKCVFGAFTFLFYWS